MMITKRKKRINNYFHLILILLLFFTAGCAKKELPTGDPGYAANNDSPFNTNYHDASTYMKEYNSTVSLSEPGIPLNENEQLLQTINKDLDLDEYPEQIIIVRMIDDVNMPIKLIISDYDEIREKYMRSWEYLTNTTNQKAYNIELEDVIGDFNSEIVFTGMTKNGETMLSLFKKNPSPPGGLFFTPICQLASDGTIEIQKNSRSSTYLMEQVTAKSFPILLEKQDRSSENSMDLVREVYDWDYSENSYVLISSTSVPGKEVEQNQLRDLYYSTDLNIFNMYLSGSWYNKKDINKIIFFAPGEEKISFHSVDLQEIYYWKYQSRTVYNGLLFIVRNQASNDIKKNLNITIKSMDTISIAFNNIDWDGNYKKVTEEFEESLFNKNRYPIRPSSIVLSDFFEDENEEIKIIFEPPRFTYLSPDKKYEGGFSIIQNIPVLNNFYLKRKLRKIPGSFTKEVFEKEILKSVSSFSSKQLLKEYYKLDRKSAIYSFVEGEIPNKELIKIWDIFLSINYKGYQDYRVAVLTLKVLDQNNILMRVENYIMEYAEIKEENKSVKTIVLTPGEIRVKGIEVVTTESQSLIQTRWEDE